MTSTLVEKTISELWTIANAIAAFSVAQFITLAFAMSEAEFRTALYLPAVRGVIVGIVVLLAAAQTAGLFWCHRRVDELLERRADVQKAVSGLARGRVLCVAILSSVAIMMMYVGELSRWAATP